MTYPIFTKLGLPEKPVLLAPLAGVSDHPFRRTCHLGGRGADLSYVEMISATALLYESKRTLKMLARHKEEEVLGVQLTGKTAEETAEAVSVLDKWDFDTIDINMGCPVKKVVKTGCGSAILKDPERVFRTVKLCREATDKPLSCKIRIGWDSQSLNAIEVAKAIQEGGADFMTVHGRTRDSDYSKPVDLTWIGRVKDAVSIPVIGNGNIFSKEDADHMMSLTRVDGVMVSRGALGNPWAFTDIKDGEGSPSLLEWYETVLGHLAWQKEAYGDAAAPAVCMRKHLLWYTKGWVGGKKAREAINNSESLQDALSIVTEFYEYLKTRQSHRKSVSPEGENRFGWDPKFEMDRKLDRGVFDANEAALSL